MKKTISLQLLTILLILLSFINISHIGLRMGKKFISNDVKLTKSVNAQQAECGPSDINNWCQVQRDPQRTGYTPEVLGTNIYIAWTHPFQPDKVYPQVQGIIYHDKVYVGTEGANSDTASMYALDAQTGEVIWQFPQIEPSIDTVGPILASVGAANNKVFFSSLDGSIYALNSETGQLVWRYTQTQLLHRGFSTSPVIAEDKVMLGGRNGIFYAFDIDINDTNNDGISEPLWQYDIGAPILQTAAYNAGRVFFGGMDMKMYGISTSDGSLVWESEVLQGFAMKDYWPVFTNGTIIIQTYSERVRGGIKPGFPFVYVWSATDPNWDWFLTNGSTVAQGNLSNITEAMTAQDTAINQYNQNPAGFYKSLYVLDENSGNELYVLPHFSEANTMNGTQTPPCVDRDGYLILPFVYHRGTWGRMDLASQRVVDILNDNTDRFGGVLELGDVMAGTGNSDENMNVSCTQNMILTMHTQEYNAQYTGMFDLDNRRWITIRLGWRNGQMSSNTQGGGGNPASIANGMIYHITYHELVARSAN